MTAVILVKLRAFAYFSVMYPIKYDAIMNPTKYPPVDPRNISIPPVIPPNHGMNAIPKTTYKIWLKQPYFLPRNNPEHNTANVCAVIGTGVHGRGIII